MRTASDSRVKTEFTCGAAESTLPRAASDCRCSIGDTAGSSLDAQPSPWRSARDQIQPVPTALNQQLPFVISRDRLAAQVPNAPSHSSQPKAAQSEMWTEAGPSQPERKSATTPETSEREKGFEPSTLALAIRSSEDPRLVETIRDHPQSSHSQALAESTGEATVQNRPTTTAEVQPALHTRTTQLVGSFGEVEDPDSSTFLSVREVAERLKVSRATIYSMVERGELPSMRVSNSIRIRSEDVDSLSQS